MVKFHETLSERTVYLRYFHLMNLEQRTQHDRLTRICFIDYDREMALVAERRNPENGEVEILGVGRMKARMTERVTGLSARIERGSSGMRLSLDASEQTPATGGVLMPLSADRGRLAIDMPS